MAGIKGGFVSPYLFRPSASNVHLLFSIKLTTGERLLSVKPFTQWSTYSLPTIRKVAFYPGLMGLKGHTERLLVNMFAIARVTFRPAISFPHKVLSLEALNGLMGVFRGHL
jgi:hypothetical protein